MRSSLQNQPTVAGATSQSNGYRHTCMKETLDLQASGDRCHSHPSEFLTHYPARPALSASPQSDTGTTNASQQVSSSCIATHAVQLRTPSPSEMCQPTGIYIVEFGLCRIVLRPDDIGISTRWLTNTRSGFVQLYLTPGGTPFLRSQTQQQQFVNSGRHHCVEPPLSPCARVHLCGRGLTDVGEGNAVSTSAQPVRKHEAKREDPKSNMTARAEQRFPNAILCSAMTLSPRSAKPYSNQWKLDYWIGVVVQRVEDQRSEPPWHIQYPFGTRQQSHDCGMTSSRA